MSYLDTNNNQSDLSDPSSESLRYKHQVESALQQADLRIERSVPLRDGTKAPQAGETAHTDTDNHRRPTSIEGSCSLHTGRNLLAIDIDDHDTFPNKVKPLLRDTLTITSPHGGEHLLYHVPDDTDITSTRLSNGAADIQYRGKYIVCPGSYIDHSHCGGCSRSGTDQYIPNDQPITTISEADHPNLLNWLRDIGGNQQSTSNPNTSPSNQHQLDRLDRVQAKRECDWFYRFLHDEVGNAARRSIHTVLGGGTIPSIDSCDDGTIDRSHADEYALTRLYGAFDYRGDDPDQSRQNTVAVFRYCVQANKWHIDGQPRKLLATRTPGAYLHHSMNYVQDNFDRSSWYRWYNWDSEDHYSLSWGSGPSRLTKATVLAAIEYLTSFDGEQAVPIDQLQERYRADFEQYAPDEVAPLLSIYTTNTHTCPSPNPPVRTDGGADNTGERASKRIFPIKQEVIEMAYLLNRGRKPATFGDALSEMVNNPNPPMSVVHAYCPNRANGERHVYYLDEQSCGDRDPADAEYVKLQDRKLEPTTRKPVGESTESLQEMPI